MTTTENTSGWAALDRMTKLRNTAEELDIIASFLSYASNRIAEHGPNTVLQQQIERVQQRQLRLLVQQGKLLAPRGEEA